MIKILKYSLFDFLRSRWTFFYFLFFLGSASVILYLSNDLSKAIASLMNITLIITPLMGTLFGVINYYNSRDFLELLLAQPVKRQSVFLGMYFGIASSLALSYLLGLLIPFALYGLMVSSEIGNFIILIIAGVMLSFIFSAIAFLIAITTENKLKGFGLAILVWLFMAFIYDGLFLLVLLLFEEYPLEQTSLFMAMFNPIDLSRILVMLKLDISALMGYTGAVFKRFFGTELGIVLSFIALSLWFIIPIFGFVRSGKTKDF